MRYERQILVDEISHQGMNKLKKARVLVIGAGGLGCPALTYLVCAGIGYIRIADDDTVTESNLNRQFLYGSSDIGMGKASCAKKVLNKQNPDVEIEVISERVSADNIYRILNDINIVVDCVDNIKTRLIVNDACLNKNIPLIEGGISGFYGFLTAITRETPCIECMGFFDNESNSPAGTLGATAGVIGCLQATECIKMILDIKSDLLGYMLQYDGIGMSFDKIKVSINPECNAHKMIKKEIR